MSRHSDVIWEESVRLDLRDAANRQLMYDGAIPWKTPLAVLWRSGAH
jgi:lipopolysaccharide/colanic/teichoic acid biosynthesis glycosyltransferase